MSDDFNLLDKTIENYLNNRLLEYDRIAFENKLQQDVVLRKNVLELIALKLLYNKELYNLQQKIQAIEKELSNEKFFED
ncbi:MAG: hypothetical protein V9G42_04660 [Bacteroidia bacterium]